MKSLHARRSGELLLSGMLLGTAVLAACGRNDAPAGATAATSVGSSATPATSALAAASAASLPIAGVIPQAEDAAGSGVPGPGSGTTAVGGMAAQQDQGGAALSKGSKPAPTGGDGAASASLASPK